jgi:hypothetical protein
MPALTTTTFSTARATDDQERSMTDEELTQKLLHATTDAQVWAQEWIKIASLMRRDQILDEGWMIGWFANAMCVAEDHLRRRLEAATPPK